MEKAGEINVYKMFREVGDDTPRVATVISLENGVCFAYWHAEKKVDLYTSLIDFYEKHIEVEGTVTVLEINETKFAEEHRITVQKKVEKTNK